MIRNHIHFCIDHNAPSTGCQLRWDADFIESADHVGHAQVVGRPITLNSTVGTESGIAMSYSLENETAVIRKYLLLLGIWIIDRLGPIITTIGSPFQRMIPRSGSFYPILEHSLSCRALRTHVRAFPKSQNRVPGTLQAYPLAHC